MNKQRQFLQAIERYLKKYFKEFLDLEMSSNIDIVYKVLLQANSSHIIVGKPMDTTVYCSISSGLLEYMCEKNKAQMQESIQEESLKIESVHELLNLAAGYALNDVADSGDTVDMSPPDMLDGTMTIECQYDAPCYKLEFKSPEHGTVGFYALHSSVSIEEEIKKEIEGIKKAKKPVTVMVVDDAKISVQKTSLLLEEMGHEVVGSCATGECAVKKYGVFNPDIVTMDISMPDMDGIEATRKILADFPDALIVILTTHGQEKLVMEAIKAGAKGYILKPVAKDKLGETIDKVIEKFKS